MAPRAAKKAAKATPFDGLQIATSGRFPGVTQASLQQRITALGATIASSVTADTDFLISTEKDVESNSNKVKAAAAHSVPAVSLDWLEECEQSNTKADTSNYLLTASQQTNGTKKRAASPDAPEPKKPKITENAKIGDGQNAKSKVIAIDVDEYCSQPQYKVYIDNSDGTIFDASLNQTNASANNNKFYKIQLICNSAGTDFLTWTRWGRVGERGQMAMLGNGSLDDAKKNFDKKFKDKSGLKWDDRGAMPKAGKYAYVERSYNPDSDDEEDDAANTAGDSDKKPIVAAECTLDKPTQDLMRLIFNQQYFDATMSALNYDANKLPLGKLSKGTIARGFQALKDLSGFLDATDEDSREQMEKLSNLYYSVIPHDFGRNRPPVIRDIASLKQEIDLLESLSDMKDAAAMLKDTLKDDGGIHKLDKQFQGLGMNEMSPLDHDSKEFTEIHDYLNDSKGSTHNFQYKVEDIFRIERQGEFDRFEQSEYSKIDSNRRLLWHGSRVTNFGGILGQGLRIAPPEAPVSGYMFGKGIYLADMSSKSAGYCNAYYSGGTALLLLCEAELGNPMHELTGSSYTAGEDARAKGMYSTWGMGRTGPSKWKDAKCVNSALKGCMMPDVSVTPGATNIANAGLYYNEYIVYDVAQVRLRYLLRVSM